MLSDIVASLLALMHIPGYPALHSNNIRQLIPEYPAFF